MNQTYTLDKDGNLVINTQQPISVEDITQSIAQCDSEMVIIQTEKDTLLQQLADIADQVPEKAEIINAIPDVADFRATLIASPSMTPPQNQVANSAL